MDMKVVRKIVGWFLKILLGLYVLGILFLLLVKVMGWADFRASNEEIIQELYEESIEDFQFRQIVHDDLEMEYLLVNTPTPDLPTVTFVHGSPGGLTANMNYLTDTSLLHQYAMISVDRLGYGNSQKGKAEQSLYKQGAIIAEILKQTPAQKHILVGHSYGCSVIARMAMDFPDLVGGIIMIGAPLDPELEPPTWWRYIVDFPLIRWAVPSDLKVCNQELLPLKKELQAIYSMWEQVQCPVIFIQGTEDTLVPAENVNFGEKMMTESPMLKKMMDEGGDHFIFWTKPDMVREAIEVVKEF